MSIDDIAEVRAKFAADFEAAKRRQEWLERMTIDEIEPDHTGENPGQRRSERETDRLFSLLDEIAAESGAGS